MKKVFLMMVTIAFVAISTISCKSEKKEHTHEHAQTAYACPMECEGEKTYADKDAKCPVCKMKLVAKKGEGSHEHNKKEEHGGAEEHDEHSGDDKDAKHNEEGHEHDSDGEN